MLASQNCVAKPAHPFLHQKHVKRDPPGEMYQKHNWLFSMKIQVCSQPFILMIGSWPRISHSVVGNKVCRSIIKRIIRWPQHIHKMIAKCLSIIVIVITNAVINWKTRGFHQSGLQVVGVRYSCHLYLSEQCLDHSTCIYFQCLLNHHLGF